MGKVALGAHCRDNQNFLQTSMYENQDVFRDAHLSNLDWAYMFSRIAGKLLSLRSLDWTTSYPFDPAAGSRYGKDDHVCADY
jgi:hypothetical protein